MGANLARVLAATTRRMRAQRALSWSAHALCASTSALTAVQLVRVLTRDGRLAPSSALAVAACTTIGALAGALWPVADVEAARALDGAGALEGRVRAAVALSVLAPEARTPFMDAALRDAALHAGRVAPRDAAPLRAPRATLGALLALAASLVVTLWPAAPPTPGARPPTQAAAPVRLSPEELAAARAATPSPRARAGSLASAHDRFDALLADLAAQRISRDAALARVLQLASDLRAATVQADEDARAAHATREALAGFDASHAAGGGRLRAAARQLRTGRLAPGERERLARALEAARTREAERARQAATTPSEPHVLTRPERARGESEAPTSAPARTLERLSRALAEAAAALRDDREPRAAADALERLADTMRDEAATAQQRDEAAADTRALAGDVAQLRELLQRAADPSTPRADARPERANGDEAPARTDREARFVQRARGEPEGDGAPDAGAQTVGRASDDASGDGGPAARASELAEATIALPQSTVTFERTRPSTSVEHDATELANPTRRAGTLEDHRLEGAASAPPSRSRVIGRAAGAGFASAPYRKVYADYRAHAEAVLARDEVPEGMRYVVRRYFQLVRPRAPDAP